MLITNTGRVEQRVVDAGADLLGDDGEALVARCAPQLNARRRRAAAHRGRRPAARRCPSGSTPADRDLVRPVVRALDDALVEEREERVVLAGTANLARFGTDFPLTIGPVLEALEEQVVLLRLLGELGRRHRRASPCASATRTRTPGCRPPRSCPSATAPAPSVVAGLGVLGPTRMDYPTTMAIGARRRPLRLRDPRRH